MSKLMTFFVCKARQAGFNSVVFAAMVGVVVLILAIAAGMSYAAGRLLIWASSPKLDAVHKTTGDTMMVGFVVLFAIGLFCYFVREAYIIVSDFLYEYRMFCSGRTDYRNEWTHTVSYYVNGKEVTKEEFEEDERKNP